jgi:hypothetical protein
VSDGAGIEPRTVAKTALAVRRSNHSARSHPPYNIDNVGKHVLFIVIYIFSRTRVFLSMFGWFIWLTKECHFLMLHFPGNGNVQDRRREIAPSPLTRNPFLFNSYAKGRILVVKIEKKITSLRNI